MACLNPACWSRKLIPHLPVKRAAGVSIPDVENGCEFVAAGAFGVWLEVQSRSRCPASPLLEVESDAGSRALITQRTEQSGCDGRALPPLSPPAITQ
jgi:hypothetical protein